MKITIQSNFGRFATSASVELPEVLFDETIDEKLDAQVIQLLRSGLENELFRAGGSAGYKAVIALGGMSLATEEQPSKAIDKKTPRSSIPFSQERATALAKAMNEAVNGKDSKLPRIDFAVTGEYEYGKNGTGPSKEARAMWAALKKLPTERMDAAMVVLGLEPGDEDDDEKGANAIWQRDLQAKRDAAVKMKATLFGA